MFFRECTNTLPSALRRASKKALPARSGAAYLDQSCWREAGGRGACVVVEKSHNTMATVGNFDSDMCLLPLADADDQEKFYEAACALRSSINYCIVRDPTLFNGSTRHSPVEGQVGLTCVFCKDIPTKEKVGISGAVSFPGTTESIYKNATVAVKR